MLTPPKPRPNYYPFGSSLNTRSFSAGSGFRFGFNTQQKDKEVYNNNETYTATFWEYDGRLGRRWNVDPKPNIWESQYSTFGGNPVGMKDILGDKWKNKSDEETAAKLNNSLEKRKTQLKTIGEKLTRRADKLESLGRLEKANKLRKNAEETITGAKEMEKAQDEIKEIGLNSIEFTFKGQSTSNMNKTYMDENHTIVIEYNSEANAIHELTHAYQHLSGQSRFIAGTLGALYVDAVDEQQAYIRQFFYFPASVKELESDVEFKIKTCKDITVDFVINLYATDINGIVKQPYKELQRDAVNCPYCH